MKPLKKRDGVGHFKKHTISRMGLHLNQFKKTFQESPMFFEVELPIANIEQKSEIPFSLSFRIKEPANLYYH